MGPWFYPATTLSKCVRGGVCSKRTEMGARVTGAWFVGVSDSAFTSGVVSGHFFTCGTDRTFEICCGVRFGITTGELAYLTPNAFLEHDSLRSWLLAGHRPPEVREWRERLTCNSTHGSEGIRVHARRWHAVGLIMSATSLSVGLTQAQLDHFFETSMSMIMGFFADLEVTLLGSWIGSASAEAQR